ncbi:peptidoglycan DD-metalloendopeptidase family protein [Jiulongibacter sp. NS-SX5]|uniref:peptidoglycan DD-metalloendopeptidase family protein n=1 Tax=Jiulongibacter sp. NS-SX5 TaxID=3463854 RepID=UPI00405941E3
MPNILEFDLSTAKCAWLDFTANNHELQALNPDDTALFTKYVFDKINKQEAVLGIGGWLEDRTVYNSREQFNKGKSRSMHLGVDIWMPADTPLFTPEDCKIHSFANNTGFGNYGPTVILEGLESGLFLLFGHLTLDSIMGIEKGQTLTKGAEFAAIGNYPINGDWPPHLHFQIMNDMLGQEGDFPGVCAKSELKVMTKICLNPYPYLGIEPPASFL